MNIPNFSDTLIVTDLDGTFFGNHTELVKRNIDALDVFRKNGGFFSLATGRTHNHIQLTFPESVELTNAPVIACNGSIVYDLQGERTVLQTFLDKKAARELIDYQKKNYPLVAVRISVPEGFMTSQENIDGCVTLQKDFEKFPPSVNRVVPEEDWDKYDWLKLVFRGDIPSLEKMKEEVVPMFGDRLTISNSGPDFLEAQNIGISKASRLEVVRAECERISGKKVRLICCGDYENDYEMLKAADVSVCPSNACELIKNTADFCLCSNTEGLIADIINMVAKEKGYAEPLA